MNESDDLSNEFAAFLNLSGGSIRLVVSGTKIAHGLISLEGIFLSDLIIKQLQTTA